MLLMYVGWHANARFARNSDMARCAFLGYRFGRNEEASAGWVFYDESFIGHGRRADRPPISTGCDFLAQPPIYDISTFLMSGVMAPAARNSE